MPKNEILIQSLLNDYFENKIQQINNNIYDIFLTGFIFGALFAYTSLFPITIGIILGYMIARRQINFIDNIVSSIKSFSLFSSLDKIKLNNIINN